MCKGKRYGEISIPSSQLCCKPKFSIKVFKIKNTTKGLPNQVHSAVNQWSRKA